MKKIITKNQLITDLTEIGVYEGDHVAVTLSLKSIGYVKGGPNTLIDALLEVVGPKGTIMMNTFTMSASLFSLSEVFFDPKSTIPYTGLVPKTILNREDVIRSRHPTCSVAAIGYLADYLTKEHNEKANSFLPYEKLAEVNGKYLCIGIGNRLVAIRHEAQRRAGLWILPVYLGVYFKNCVGNKELFIRKNPPCYKNLHKIVPIVEKKIKLIRSKIGLADSILVNANDFIEAMTDILKKEPQLNLCDDVFCFNCRELERRLDLYSRIDSPHYFQKHALFRTILFMVNKLVLSQYRKEILIDKKTNQKIIKERFSDYIIQVLLKIAARLLKRN